MMLLLLLFDEFTGFVSLFGSSSLTVDSTERFCRCGCKKGNSPFEDIV